MAAIRRERTARTPSDDDGPVRSAGTGTELSPGLVQPESESPRRARRMASGEVIRDAAAALFLEKGYHGTSMDDIAATARISKQTIYTHFADKEALFRDLVLGNAGRVEEFAESLMRAVRDAPDVRTSLRELGRQYIRIVARPDVVRLRHLVIAESGRFPDVARAYYEQVPERMYAALADLVRELSKRGALQVDDPEQAARQFAWLVVGVPMDRGMFLGADDPLSDAELDRLADAGVTVFLAAYGG